jgi:hypothetical protein
MQQKKKKAKVVLGELWRSYQAHLELVKVISLLTN